MCEVTLVSCVAGKAKAPCEARDLYRSAWFAKARGVAELGGRWYILSAKHGLLLPWQVVEPYDQTLGANAAEWADGVAASLSRLESPGEVLLLAGARYAGPLGPRLERAGFSPRTPLRGLGIGRQLAWLNGRLGAS